MDTCSPATYLRPDTLARIAGLADGEAVPTSTNAAMHGVTLSVAPSRAHFSNVDLLGQDFLAAARCTLTVTYPTKTCTLTLI